MVHLLLAIIYIAFISLGLPDALLGAAWPMMHQDFSVPVSYMGIVALLISSGTVVSSLLSDGLTKRFGTGFVTAVSVAMTAVSLLGFSTASAYWMLILWAVPYGLGAGSVDASLNNYVAVHYASRHMSWLHCMWGIGAASGPYIMGAVLTGGMPWNMGYSSLGVLQAVLSVILFVCIPVWQKTDNSEPQSAQPLKLREVICLSGAKEVLIMFFCYCALEQTVGQWASSYLVLDRGLEEETAASCASLFYAGLTVGRAASGFMTIRFSDKAMIRIGSAIVGVGVFVMLLPLGKWGAMFGLTIIGLGCAPIYPCTIHATPAHFGADKSQAIIGMQMASAYLGICIVPPLFGVLADALGIGLLPILLMVILAIMLINHERLNQKTGNIEKISAEMNL